MSVVDLGYIQLLLLRITLVYIQVIMEDCVYNVGTERHPSLIFGMFDGSIVTICNNHYPPLTMLCYYIASYSIFL